MKSEHRHALAIMVNVGLTPVAVGNPDPSSTKRFSTSCAWHHSFRTDFASPIQLFNDEQAISRFRKVTAPFLMRRLKSDKNIISDLPDKIEQNQYNTLTKPQAALYEKTVQMAMAEIEGINDTDHQSLFKRQG